MPVDFKNISKVRSSTNQSYLNVSIKFIYVDMCKMFITRLKLNFLKVLRTQSQNRDIFRKMFRTISYYFAPNTLFLKMFPALLENYSTI